MDSLTDNYIRSDKQLPALFGKHMLLTKLATGGMGEVFLARMQSASGFEKLLVLKRLLPHLTEDPRFIAMFLDEARIAARISHANVCQIYELGNVDGQFYLTMEYLEGASLAQVIERRTVDPRIAGLRFLASLLAQVSEGLHCAHMLRTEDGQLAGVVHRDVCLSNIYVTWSGAAKLIDFGVAKARDVVSKTRPGAVKGTYAYMSPEQLRGEDVDARSDIYSLGIVAWETLTGRRLYKRDTDYRTFKAITDEPVAKVTRLRPDVPPALAQAVDRALARDPAERFQSAREFGRAVANAAAALGPPMATLACGAVMGAAFGPVIDRHRARVAALNRVGAEKSAHQRTSTMEIPTRRGHGGSVERLTTHPVVKLPLMAPTATDVRIAREPPEPEFRERPASGADDEAQESATALELAAVAVPPSAETSVSGLAQNSRHLVALLASLSAVLVAIIMVLMLRGDDEAAASEAGVAHGVDGGQAAVVAVAPVVEPVPARAAPPAAKSSVAAAKRPEKPAKRKPRSHSRTHKAGKKKPAVATRKSPGRLTLQSSPYATIYIDGKKLGYTPIVAHKVSAGVHKVRAVSSADGREQRLTIKVTADGHLRRKLKW